MDLGLQKWTVRLRSRYQASQLPRFFQWWWGELRTLVPESVRRYFRAPRPRLLLAVEDGELRVWRVSQETGEHCDTLDTGQRRELLQTRLQDHLHSFEEGAPRTVLCLPAANTLERELQMPAAAESNLHQAVGFELDRQTPFSREQVYYDIQPLGRENQMIRLRLSLTLREEVDNRVRELEKLGVRLDAVDVAESGGGESPPELRGINLLPVSRRAHHIDSRVWWNWGLGAASALLLALVMWQSLYLRGQTRAELEQQREAMRAEAMAVRELRNQLETATESANFLARKREQAPDPLLVLAEVTQRIPTDTWVQRFQIEGTELQLQGLSDAAQQLIEILNDSPLLENTYFRGAISTDRRSNKERFTAVSEIQPGREVDLALAAEKASASGSAANTEGGVSAGGADSEDSAGGGDGAGGVDNEQGTGGAGGDQEVEGDGPAAGS